MQNKDIDSYRKSLDAITSTLGKTKYDFRALSVMLVVYGAIRLVLEILADILATALSPSAVGTGVMSGILYALVIAQLVCLIIYRTKVIRKKTQTADTLKILDIWGFVAFVLPIIFVASAFFLSLSYDEETVKSGAVIILGMLPKAMNAIVLIFAIFITAVITEDKNLMFLAPFLVILAMAYLGIGVNASYMSLEQMVNSFAIKLSNFENIVWSAYILLGVYFMVANKRKYEAE